MALGPLDAACRMTSAQREANPLIPGLWARKRSERLNHRPHQWTSEPLLVELGGLLCLPAARATQAMAEEYIAASMGTGDDHPRDIADMPLAIYLALPDYQYRCGDDVPVGEVVQYDLLEMYVADPGEDSIAWGDCASFTRPDDDTLDFANASSGRWIQFEAQGNSSPETGLFSATWEVCESRRALVSEFFRLASEQDDDDIAEGSKRRLEGARTFIVWPKQCGLRAKEALTKSWSTMRMRARTSRKRRFTRLYRREVTARLR